MGGLGLLKRPRNEPKQAEEPLKPAEDGEVKTK